MAQLVLYSTPASRARGQSFGDNFISAAKVALNGGTLIGAPTIDFGAVLNGTTDSIVYQLSGNEFNSPAITIVGIFWPDFADDGAGHTIYSSTADDYAIRKNTGDILAITLGNVTIANIAKSVWLPHWIDGGRNVIAVIGRNADTDVILNDSVILSGDPSAWTPKPVTELYIGSLSGGSNKFKGKIEEIQVYKGALTPQEIADFGTQTTYNYRNQAIGDWPMLDAQHGGSYGANVLLNSDFEGGFTAGLADDWVKYQTVDITYSEAAGRLGGSCQRMVSNAASIIHAGVRQAIATVAGIKNKFGFWVRTDDVVGGPTIEVSNSDFSLTTLSVSAGVWTYFEFEFTPTSTTSTIYFQHNSLSLNSYVEYDDTWAIQGAPETLDVSRSKKPAIFGGTITKQTKRGYGWGASSYMLTAAGVISAPITQCTAFVAFRMSNSVSNQAMFDFQKPDGTAVGCRISFTGSANEFFFHSGLISTSRAARLIVDDPVGRLFIITGTHDGTDTRMCVNGVFGTDAPAPLAPAATAESIVAIGARAGTAAPLRDGSIVYQSGLLDFALTPLQILDLEGKIKRSINAV